MIASASFPLPFYSRQTCFLYCFHFFLRFVLATSFITFTHFFLMELFLLGNSSNALLMLTATAALKLSFFLIASLHLEPSDDRSR